MIDILYFARLRESLGLTREQLDLSRQTGIGSVADLLAHLRARGEPWSTTLGEGESVLAAVNQEIARPDTTIRDGDEVALFPPVTGG
jgi:molybdopterin synthase sulfur carrier subunit